MFGEDELVLDGARSWPLAGHGESRNRKPTLMIEEGEDIAQY